MKKILCTLAVVVLVCVLASCNLQIGTSNQPAVPSIAISEDGYWIINGEKTNVKAEGEKGDKGDQGEQGEKGENGEDGTYTNENPQGLAFYLKDDGTYAVEIGYAKYLSKIEIPATYNGRAVTEIGRFSDGDGNDILQEVIIPDSVTLIGDYAFENCTRLNSIVIPDSVTSIGDYAFAWCFNFNSVTIPDSVTSVGDWAFHVCDISSLKIGDSVTTIGSNAFSGNLNLKTATIPDTVISIGESAFSMCNGDLSVTFANPNGWWYAIDANATSGTEISVDDLSNPTIAGKYLREYSWYYWFRTQGAELPAPKPPVGTKVGNTCPTISLDIVDQEGKFDVQKENSEGRVVVLNFWFTTCGPCLEELPYFYEVATDYADQISVAAIHIEQPGVDVTGFITNDSGHPEWNDGNMTIGWDTGMKLINLFNIQACPVTVVINTDGIITDYFVGGLHKDELVSAVEKALLE